MNSFIVDCHSRYTIRGVHPPILSNCQAVDQVARALPEQELASLLDRFTTIIHLTPSTTKLYSSS